MRFWATLKSRVQAPSKLTSPWSIDLGLRERRRGQHGAALAARRAHQGTGATRSLARLLTRLSEQERFGGSLARATLRAGVIVAGVVAVFNSSRSSRSSSRAVVAGAATTTTTTTTTTLRCRIHACQYIPGMYAIVVAAIASGHHPCIVCLSVGFFLRSCWFCLPSLHDLSMLMSYKQVERAVGPSTSGATHRNNLVELGACSCSLSSLLAET